MQTGSFTVQFNIWVFNIPVLPDMTETKFIVFITAAAAAVGSSDKYS